MSSISELEGQFLEVIRESAFQPAVAHQLLDHIRACCTDPQHVLLLEVSLHWRETHQYAENLQRLYEGIIQQPVRDPLIYAKACVVASKLYARDSGIQSFRIMLQVFMKAPEFFKRHNSSNIRKWGAAYLYNMSVSYWRQGFLDLAEDHLTALTTRSSIVYAEWRPKAHLLLCIIETQRGNSERAKAHLAQVEEKYAVCDIAWLLFAKACLLELNICQTDSDDLDKDFAELICYYQAAYTAAKVRKDHFLAADALEHLAMMYIQSDRPDLLWYVEEVKERAQMDSPHATSDGHCYCNPEPHLSRRRLYRD